MKHFQLLNLTGFVFLALRIGAAAPVDISIQLTDKNITAEGGQTASIPLRVTIKNTQDAPVVLPSLAPPVLIYQAARNGMLTFQLQRKEKEGFEPVEPYRRVPKPEVKADNRKTILYTGQTISFNVNIAELYNIASPSAGSRMYTVCAVFGHGHEKIMSNYMSFTVHHAKKRISSGAKALAVKDTGSPKMAVRTLMAAYKNKNWSQYLQVIDLIELMKNSYSTDTDIQSYYRRYKESKKKDMVLDRFKHFLTRKRHEQYGDLIDWTEPIVKPDNVKHRALVTVRQKFRKLKSNAYIFHYFKINYEVEYDPRNKSWKVVKYTVYIRPEF